jgi:pilus assembly protein CpaE
MAEAINSSDRIDSNLIERLLTRCTDRLSLLSSPAQVEKALGLELDSLEPIIDAIRNAAPLIILDIPNVWTQLEQACPVDRRRRDHHLDT